MAYLGKTPSQGVRNRYYFTATGGETSLSGTDDNGNTLTYTDGNYVDVSLNGVSLVAGTDYNTTTANTIGGLTALTASDVVEIVVYDTFSVFSGAFTGDISLGDNVKAKFGASDDLQIYHDGNNSYIDDQGTGDLWIRADNLRLTDGNGTLFLYGSTDSVTRLYHAGTQKFSTTSTGIDVTGTVTAGALTVDGGLFFGSGTNYIYEAATDNVNLRLGTDGPFIRLGEVVSGNEVAIGNASSSTYIKAGSINPIKVRSNGDISFYDSTGTTQSFFWDASTQRLGLGTTSPATALDVNGTVTATTDTDTTNTGSVTLDFSANQNFVLTLTGNVTLANPTTETVGQSGFIVFIQDATGGRTVSLGTDYETAGGAGLTLSTAASTTDIVPYVVAASGRILLGTPQLAFA